MLIQDIVSCAPKTILNEKQLIKQQFILHVDFVSSNSQYLQYSQEQLLIFELYLISVILAS